MDICDYQHFESVCREKKVTNIIHQAAIISALAEKKPELAYKVNVDGAKNALDVAKATGCSVFLPTTIGVYGGNYYPKDNTPLRTIKEPQTIYGVCKLFTENLGTYYHQRYGVDFRCLRYPGVISSESHGYNGTVSYPTEVFFNCLKNGHYTFYL